MGSVAPLPELELFSRPPVQLAAERDIFSVYRPLSVIDSRNPIQFEIRTPVNEYIKLNETELRLKLKVSLRKANSATVTIDDWKLVGPVNNFMHSIFSSVKVFIGDAEVSLNAQHYAYKAYIETLLGFSGDAKCSHLQSVGWFDDDPKNMDSVPKPRSELIRPKNAEEEKEIQLKGKLHLDLTFQQRALLGGVTLKIHLFPNNSNFYMLSKDANIFPIIEITDASLHVHKMRVTQHVVEAHAKALQSASSLYPITRTEIKTTNVPANSLDVTIDNVVHGQLPRRVLLTCVSNDAFNGTLLKNPFNFKHYDISSLALYLDGMQFPPVAYTPDFEKELFLDEFLGLYEALNQDSTDCVMKIQRSDYSNGFTIFGFNFTPDLSSGAGSVGHINEMRSGSLRIAMQFKKPLPEPINILLYCEYDNTILINADREAFTDFSRWIPTK